MPLELDIQKDNYSPVILVEFDIFKYLTFSTTKESFIWFSDFNNLYPLIDPSLLTGNWELDEITGIGSMKTEEGFLIPVLSYDQCVAIRESFYYDPETKRCYYHMPRGDSPDLFSTLIGEIHGTRKGGTKEDYNDIPYPAIVNSIPSISRSKSDYYNARSSNEGGDVEYNNADGELDALAKDTTVIGNALRIKYGMDNYNYGSFRTIFTGYIRNISVSTTKLKMTFKQNLDKLNIPIPTNRFTLAQYPYLNDNNDGKIIAFIYGRGRDFPCVCLNENEPGATGYIFKIGDMQFHKKIRDIVKVYRYDENNYKQDVTADMIKDLVNGQFTLTNLLYTFDPGQTVTCDYEGYEDDAGNLIENALDIIRDLIVNHTKAQDNELYFNPLKWDDALAYDVTPEIMDEMTVAEVIEKITQEGTLADFQIDSDGRYSCGIFDKNAPVKLIIEDYDMPGGEIVLEYQQEKLVSELVIKYDKDAYSGDYRAYTNTAYKKINNDLYETYLQKIIETIINNKPDAEAFAAAFMDIFGMPYAQCTIETSMVSVLIEISDIVQVEFKRPKAPDLGTWKCEVKSISNDFNTNKNKLGLRLFEEVID